MRDATVSACAVISLLVAACATVEPSASIPPSAAPSLTPDYETLPEDTVMIVWPIQHESRDPYPDLVVDGFGPAGDVRFHAVVPRSGQAEDAPGMPFPGLIVGSHHLASVRRSEYGGPVLQVLVYDLTNPTAGPAWTFSASGAWPGPRGLLAIRSDDWRRMTVLDIRRQRTYEFPWELEDFDAWTADGAGFFVSGRDPASGPGWPAHDGVLNFANGTFSEVSSIPPLYMASGRPATLNAEGEALVGHNAYDDMGKGTSPHWVLSGPPPSLEMLPRDPPWPAGVRTWYDSRFTDEEWLFFAWDVDGEGIIVIERTPSGTRMVRFDAPRERDVLPIDDGDAFGGDIWVESFRATGDETFAMLIFRQDPPPSSTGGAMTVDFAASFFMYSSATGDVVRVVGPVPNVANFAGYAPR